MRLFSLKPTSFGDRGQDVVVAQDVLGLLGYELSEDEPGLYEEATRLAVRAFQSDCGLEPTGEVDAATLDVIHEILDTLADDDGGVEEDELRFSFG